MVVRLVDLRVEFAGPVVFLEDPGDVDHRHLGFVLRDGDPSETERCRDREQAGEPRRQRERVKGVRRFHGRELPSLLLRTRFVGKTLIRPGSDIG